MANTCTRTRLNAPSGTYEISISSADINVAVHAVHGVNGKTKDTWTHTTLFNKSVAFEVAAGDRHSVNTVATFTGNASITIALSFDGKVLGRPCVLTQDGPLSSIISIVTP